MTYFGTPNTRASHHLTQDSSVFSVNNAYEGYDKVQIGNRSSMSILHTRLSNPYYNSSNTTVVLKKLLHVSSLTKNLMSVSKFAKEIKVFFEFHANVCYVKS